MIPTIETPGAVISSRFELEDVRKNLSQFMRLLQPLSKFTIVNSPGYADELTVINFLMDPERYYRRQRDRKKKILLASKEEVLATLEREGFDVHMSYSEEVLAIARAYKRELVPPGPRPRHARRLVRAKRRRQQLETLQKAVLSLIKEIAVRNLPQRVRSVTVDDEDYVVLFGSAPKNYCLLCQFIEAELNKYNVD